MSRTQPFQRIQATVVDAEADGFFLRVRFAPIRGTPAEIEDSIRLGPRGDLEAVHGVGRLLRILRSARIRAPRDPYALADAPQFALSLLQRCRGALVCLHLRRRIRRGITVWTESGVDRIPGILDFGEDVEGLWIRRLGGQSLLRIPRARLIRYATTSENSPEVISVEVPSRSRLH
ncbi:MAG: hypothetical protein VX614_10485 [Myxococcota bacterium]|nr:hypothetical protein [Myxococcota bacterium]